MICVHWVGEGMGRESVGLCLNFDVSPSACELLRSGLVRMAVVRGVMCMRLSRGVCGCMRMLCGVCFLDDWKVVISLSSSSDVVCDEGDEGPS